MYKKILKNSISLIKKAFKPVIFRDIVAVSIKVLITVLSVRHLNSQELATFLLLAMVAGYAEVFLRFKTDMSVAYFVGKEGLDQELVLSAQNTLILISVIITALVLSVMAEPLAKYIQIDKKYINIILIYLVLYCALSQIFTAFVYLHLFHEKFQLYQKMTMISSFIYLAGVCLSISSLTIFHIIASQIIGMLAAILFCFIKSNYMTKLNFSTDVKLLKRLLLRSARIYILSGVSIMQQNLVLTLAGFYLSLTSVAYLGVLKQFFQLSERVPAFFQLVFFGKIMRKGNENKKLALLIAISVGVITFISLSVIYFILGPINTYIFNAEFPKLQQYFILFAPSVLIMCVVSPVMDFMMSENHLIRPAVNLSLSIAIALVFGEFTSKEYNIIWLSRVYFIQASSMLLLTLYNFYYVEIKV